MRRVKQLIFLVLLSLLIISGCSQRKNPLQMNIGNGGLFENTFEFSSLENVLNDPVGRTLLVYLPPDYQEGIANKYKYPILFLLHGFKENGWSYQHFYNVKTIADQMTSTGEIQPMIIIMPDGAGIFGGSFFNNSVLADSSNFGGRYEDYVTKELMDRFLYNYGKRIRGVTYKVSDFTYIDTTITKTTDTVCTSDTTKQPPCPPPDTTTRIITFVYTRIDTITLIDHDTTVFVSDSILFQKNLGISGHANGGYGALRIATDYPLTFGSVSAMSAPLSSDSIFLRPLIEAFFDSNGVDESGNGYHQIDLDNLDRLSSFFFAMAVAFSPHNPSDPDLSTFFQLTPSGLGVDLPFNSLGHLDSLVWQKWLNNDMKTRITNLPSSDTLVKKLKFYIDCGEQDEFGFNEQADVFYNVLLGKVPASNVTFETYSGYPGYPALNNSFIYDRLRKVLKFHSDCFTAP